MWSVIRSSRSAERPLGPWARSMAFPFNLLRLLPPFWARWAGPPSASTLAGCVHKSRTAAKSKTGVCVAGEIRPESLYERNKETTLAARFCCSRESCGGRRERKILGWLADLGGSGAGGGRRLPRGRARPGAAAVRRRRRARAGELDRADPAAARPGRHAAAGARPGRDAGIRARRLHAGGA